MVMGVNFILVVSFGLGIGLVLVTTMSAMHAAAPMPGHHQEKANQNKNEKPVFSQEVHRLTSHPLHAVQRGAIIRMGRAGIQQEGQNWTTERAEASQVTPPLLNHELHA
jgi:hypothetical protein